MARQFGHYSLIVPLGATWEESLILEDANGSPVDLTGYDVVAQLHAERPARDPEDGGPATDPVLEITTVGFHDTVPNHVVEGFVVDDPRVNGDGYAIPVVTGRPAFLPNNTVLA